MLPTELNYFKSMGSWASICGYNPHGGNCLDLAVGIARAMASRGKTVKVVLLTRVDDDDVEKDILSHAVIRDRHGDYDADGDRAIDRWIQDFNSVRRSNNEEEVQFNEEEYTGDFLNLYELCLARFNMNNPSRELMEHTYANMRLIFH